MGASETHRQHSVRRVLAFLRVKPADRFDLILLAIVLVTSLADETLAGSSTGLVGDIPPIALGLLTYRWPLASTVALSAWSMACAVPLIPYEWQGVAGLTGYIVIQSLVRRGFPRLALAYSTIYVMAGAHIMVSLAGTQQNWPGMVLLLAGLAAACAAAGHWLRSVEGAYAAQHTLALTEQRRAIARELHDGVAQQLSRVIMRTEQARLHGGATDDDLTFIHDTCQASVQDLRGMLTLLRSSENVHEVLWADSAPTVSGALDQAVERLRCAGFTPSGHVEGDPDAVTGSARTTFAAALYELTSNVIKHGRADRPCSIMVEIGPDAVEAAVLNTPRAGEENAETPQLGLIGLKERLTAVGGLLEARRGASSWVARVVLPLHPTNSEVNHG